MLTQAQKDAWIAKLRDPESKHSHWYLDRNGGYCALGHGVVAIEGQYTYDGLYRLREHVDFEHRTVIHCANMTSLAKAADYIEANVPVQEG